MYFIAYVHFAVTILNMYILTFVIIYHLQVSNIAKLVHLHSLYMINFRAWMKKMYILRHETMRHHLRQNAMNVSEIYIGRPIYIKDVQYIYRTSNIYIGRLISISDVRYPCPSPSPSPSPCISDVRYRYRTSDIYIGCPIYILDVQYRFRKHWWHFVLNGASYETRCVAKSLFSEPIISLLTSTGP